MPSALVTLIALLLAAPPPLNDTQRVMLGDTADFSGTADEAGLYALLQNARQWADDPQENMVGATVPDFPAIRAEPAEHRGGLFLITGTLESIVDMGLLSRVGYEDVRALTVRAPRGGVVIVYLAAPPTLAIARTLGPHQIPEARGAKVELAARFFKFIQQPNRDGQTMTYPVFVGRSMQVDADAASGGGAGPSVTVYVLPIALVLLMLGAYAMIRRAAAGRPSALEERRARREAEQMAQRQTVEYRDDLPGDPADALGSLDNEHHAEEAHGDRRD